MQISRPVRAFAAALVVSSFLIAGAVPAAHADFGFLKEWGGDGDGDGQFLIPGRVAVSPDGGRVYVVDGQHRRVQAFTANGDFITKWGSNGNSPGQFAEPLGIAVDSQGSVYVSDSFRVTSGIFPTYGAIEKFTPGGAFITEWTVADVGDIAVGAGDVIYAMTESGVKKFSPAGASLGSFPAPFDSSLAADRSGSVFVAERQGQRILRYSSSGTLVGSWGTSGQGPGRFSSVDGVGTDGAGNVYVSDPNNRPNPLVHKFSGAGAFLEAWGVQADGGVADEPGTWIHPYGVAGDGAGNVYVTDQIKDMVFKFGPGGRPIGSKAANCAQQGTKKKKKKKKGKARSTSSTVRVAKKKKKKQKPQGCQTKPKKKKKKKKRR